MTSRRRQRVCLHRAAAVLAAWGLLAAPALADDPPWTVSVGVEQGSPTGWVQVRENALEGTRLHLHGDLGVSHLTTLKLDATRSLSDTDQLHLGFSTSSLRGSTTLSAPVYFNGTIAAPGTLRTDTGYTDFIGFDAAWWHRLHTFGNGGRLWGSVGLTYVMLNFRLSGTVAPDSPGNELKEDFYVQELPVPVLGLHLREPLGTRLVLVADVTAGRLPWVDSLRTEGGEVRLAQTDTRASLGLDYRLDDHWRASAYLFHSHFAQSERSHEDGNQIRLDANGAGLALAYRF